MPRRISFEKLSSAQREIEGGAEGKRTKRKADKKLAAERKESGPQVLRTAEEVEMETAGLESARTKPKIIEIGGKEIKEDHLEHEEGVALTESKELFRKKKKANWDDPLDRRGHRRGYKPKKVERDTIREDTDIEEAA